MLEGKYTGVDADIPIVPATIKAQLTPALSEFALFDGPAWTGS